MCCLVQIRILAAQSWNRERERDSRCLASVDRRGGRSVLEIVHPVEFDSHRYVTLIDVGVGCEHDVECESIACLHGIDATAQIIISVTSS